MFSSKHSNIQIFEISKSVRNRLQKSKPAFFKKKDGMSARQAIFDFGDKYRQIESSDVIKENFEGCQWVITFCHPR